MTVCELAANTPVASVAGITMPQVGITMPQVGITMPQAGITMPQAGITMSQAWALHAIYLSAFSQLPDARC